MNSMWDKRYSAETYAYGQEPNEFLKSVTEKYGLSGSILLPAEGEGRNAVYLAKKGLKVTAFDTSEQGRKKAIKLAEKEGVDIHYEVGELFELDLIHQKYDSAALIFAHFPPPLLSKYHRKISELIKPGGVIILEGFSKGNLPLRKANPRVGGPDKEEMLFSTQGIKDDFPGFQVIKLEETEVELNEGEYHNGRGKVIRFIGKKK